jgi:hypothetical protein
VALVAFRGTLGSACFRVTGAPEGLLNGAQRDVLAPCPFFSRRSYGPHREHGKWVGGCAAVSSYTSYFSGAARDEMRTTQLRSGADLGRSRNR